MTEPLNPFQRRCRLFPGSSPHDADSLTLLIDQGWYGRAEPPLRVSAAFMPELHQPGGPQMRAILILWIDDWVAAHPRLSWPFWVESDKTTRLLEPNQITTLGRFVTRIWRYDGRQKVGPSMSEFLNAELQNHPEWGHGIGAAS